MVHAGKLSSIGAGSTLILHLYGHGRYVLLTHPRQFRSPCPHLHSARSAVEAHTGTAAGFAHRVVIDVMHHGDVDVVYRAVVVEVTAAPVAALVAEADVAKAVVDAAVIADVLAPVARIKPIMVMPVAPVAGRPQSTLVRSLHPRSGNPVVAGWSPGPVAGRPEITIVGSRRLIVVGQRRRCFGSCGYRLRAVTRIDRSLVRSLIGGAAHIWRLAGAENAGSRGRRRA